MQDNGDAARQTLFDTGSNSVGKGWYNTLFAWRGVDRWSLRLRVMGMWLDDNAHRPRRPCQLLTQVEEEGEWLPDRP